MEKLDRKRRKQNFSVVFVSVTTWCVWLNVLIHLVTARCPKTANGKAYALTIGYLAKDSNFTMQRVIQEHIKRSGDVKRCFQEPQHIPLHILNTLKLKTDGWTAIQGGIRSALHSNGADKLNIIIGPFYTNLAMVLERMNIPYLVTDYKGYEWIDMSRVQDTTDWGTMVEIRPPAQEQNLAVIDYFKLNDWMNAVMVMPQSSADNQECQNLAHQMINSGISLIPYTVNPLSENVEKMTKEVLRNVQLSRQKRVIVCSPRDVRDHLIEIVLIQAKPFDLLLKEDQIFFIVDPSSYLQPFAGAGHMYRLGLFSARCKLLAFRYVEPRHDGTQENANEAIAMDAATVTTMALHTYIDRQSARTNGFSFKRFLKALREVYLPYARTGVIRFDKHGKRTNYTLHLYNHGGEDMYRKEAEWIPEGDSFRTRLNVTGFGETSAIAMQYGIFPGVVKVVVVVEEPFVMRKSEDSLFYEGNDRYEGFTIDLLRKLANELNFEYEIYESPLNGYGVEVGNGLWDGMVQEVMTGNATLAMGAISITSKRETVIDFSLGIISTGVNILIQKPEEAFSIFQFMKPFSLFLWFAIVGASFFVSLMFFVLDYNSSDRKFTVKETAWYSIGTLLKRGTDFSPKPISQRILSAGFAFFVLITVSTYTANMAAFLTTKSLSKTVDSFDSLAQDTDMNVGTVRNSATMNFLRLGTKPVFQRLWYKIEASNGLVQNSSTGRKRVVSENYAFIFDYLINSYSEIKYCSTKAVASPILIQEHGIGMRAGAPFKTNINIALLRLKESGFIQGLKKRWWDDKRQCDVLGSKKAVKVEFSLFHMAGVFIVGLFGFFFSVSFFLSKKLYFRSKTKREQTSDIIGKETGLLCKGSPTSV